MNLNNRFVLFVHFSFFNNQNVIIVFYDSAFIEVIYISKCKINRPFFQKRLPKLAGKSSGYNTNLVLKVKVDIYYHS